MKLTPISQVLAAEAAAADEAAREQAHHCEMLAANESGLEAQEMEMIRSLHALRAARLAAAKVREDDEALIEQLEVARAKLEAAAQVLAAGGADPCGAALDAVDDSRQAGAAATTSLWTTPHARSPPAASPRRPRRTPASAGSRLAPQGHTRMARRAVACSAPRASPPARRKARTGPPRRGR